MEKQKPGQSTQAGERQGLFYFDSFTLCDSSYDSKSPERRGEQNRDVEG